MLSITVKFHWFQSSGKIILFSSSSMFVIKHSIPTANSIFQLCYNPCSSLCHSLTVQPCDGLTLSVTLYYPMFICIMFHLSSFHLLPFLRNWDPLFHLFSTNFNTSQYVRLAFVYYDHTYFNNNNYWNVAIKFCSDNLTVHVDFGLDIQGNWSVNVSCPTVISSTISFSKIINCIQYMNILNYTVHVYNIIIIYYKI